MNAFVISDTHFGHANIIKYCNRPFANVQEMDEVLIANWNSVVKPGDIVYHLGDFSMDRKHDIVRYKGMLNGEINLILGNHDRRSKAYYFSRGFNLCVDSLLLKMPDGKTVYMSHRPYYVTRYGSVHLHGHIHDKPDKLSPKWNINCSVEVQDYKPLPFEEVLKKAYEDTVS